MTGKERAVVVGAAPEGLECVAVLPGDVGHRVASRPGATLRGNGEVVSLGAMRLDRLPPASGYCRLYGCQQSFRERLGYGLRGPSSWDPRRTVLPAGFAALNRNGRHLADQSRYDVQGHLADQPYLWLWLRTPWARRGLNTEAYGMFSVSIAASRHGQLARDGRARTGPRLESPYSFSGERSVGTSRTASDPRAFKMVFPRPRTMSSTAAALVTLGPGSLPSKSCSPTGPSTLLEPWPTRQDSPLQTDLAMKNRVSHVHR